MACINMPERKLGEHTALWVALAGVVGALTGAVITGGFNYLSHQHDLDAKMIELSIGILRADPTDGDKRLREWAIDVMEKRANFKFNDELREDLINRQVPFKGEYPPLPGTDKFPPLPGTQRPQPAPR